MKIKKAFVIGSSVQNSLSPVIFNFLAKQTGIQIDYSKMQVPEDQFLEIIEMMKNSLQHSSTNSRPDSQDYSNLVGFNVTIPFKEAILASLDMLSPEVKLIKACNVVKVSSHKFSGFNTDVFGVTQSLLEFGAKLKSTKCVIFGAGGAGRAGVFALAQEQVSEITVMNRTLSRAETLVCDFRSVFPQTNFKALELDKPIPQASLYLNAIPLDAQNSQWQPDFLSNLKESNVIGFDMVYGPDKSVFEQEIEKKGHRFIGGLHMLIWQAFKTFEIWFEPLKNQQELKSKLIKEHFSR